MSCNCGYIKSRCRCKDKGLFDKCTPTKVVTNTIPIEGEEGLPGDNGDVYVPVIDDNFFDL